MLDLPAEAHLILDVRHVSDALEHDHPRPRDSIRQVAGDARGVQQVLLAHEDRGSGPGSRRAGPWRRARWRPGPDGRRPRFLRPGIPLGELDHPFHLHRLAVEGRGDQPGEHRAAEPTRVELLTHHDPRFDDGPTPGVAPGVRRGEDQALDRMGMSQGQFCATRPPNDWPTTWAGIAPMASSQPATSSAISADV